MAETILLEVAEGVATLTLNQPQRRNAMSARMGEEIEAAVASLGSREEVRVTFGTEDLREGLAAARARRAPRFRGR